MPRITNYDIDPFKRRLVTAQNLVELGITPEVVQSILQSPSLKLNAVVNGSSVAISPDGVSINETTFGNYTGPTASTLGYMAYMGIGEPSVEERADIVPPPADVLSSRSYENRSSTIPRSFQDSVAFSISNTISWSLEGKAELTLGGMIFGEQAYEYEESNAESAEKMASNTETMHNHKDDIGTQSDQQAQSTVTDTKTVTGSGTSTGHGEMSAELLLGITGSVSGSVTTSWTSTSTVSGDIAANTRVQTMAVQRRQLRQYTYELPVQFAGYVALHYPQQVPVQLAPPQSVPPATANVIAQNIANLSLSTSGGYYRLKGVAETASTLGVDHIVFGEEVLPPSSLESFSKNSPHNFPTVTPTN